MPSDEIDYSHIQMKTEMHDCLIQYRKPWNMPTRADDIIWLFKQLDLSSNWTPICFMHE